MVFEIKYRNSKQFNNRNQKQYIQQYKTLIKRMWANPLSLITKYLSSAFIDAIEKYQQIIQHTLHDTNIHKNNSSLATGQALMIKKFADLKFSPMRNQNSEYYVLRFAKSSGLAFLLAVETKSLQNVDKFNLLIVAQKNFIQMLQKQRDFNMVITSNSPNPQSSYGNHLKISLPSFEKLNFETTKRQRNYSEELKSKANKLFDAGEYDEALSYYQYALTCLSSVGTRVLRAILYANASACLYEMRLYDQAIKYADIAIRLDPAYPKPYFRKISAILQKKEFAQIPQLLLTYSQKVDNQKLQTLNNKYFTYIANTLGIFNWKQILQQPSNDNNMSDYLSHKVEKRKSNGWQYYCAKEDIQACEILLVVKPYYYVRSKKQGFNIEMDFLRILSSVIKRGFLQQDYQQQLINMNKFSNNSHWLMHECQIKAMQNMILSQQISQFRSDLPQGYGIWPQYFHFMHQCMPNCSYAHIKKSLIVSANQLIKKDSILTIDYMAYQDYPIRKSLLKQKFNINCGCQICQWVWWPKNIQQYLSIIQIVPNKQIHKYLIWQMLSWKEVSNLYCNKIFIKEGIQQLLRLLQAEANWVDVLKLIEFVRLKKYAEKNIYIEKIIQWKLNALFHVSSSQSSLLLKSVL